MILQNVLFSEEICKKNELFFRSKDKVMVEGRSVYMPDGGQVYFDTYMNIFDLKKWRELTGVEEVVLEAECRGEGTLKLFFMENGKKKEVASKHFDFSSERKAVLTPGIQKCDGYYQVEIQADKGFVVKNLRFTTAETPKSRVNIAAVICTYGKKEQVLSTIKRLEGMDDLSLYVVDNKKEIPEIKEEGLTICQNENTGGAGGFAKGLGLVRKDHKEKNYSHVLFMDDDAYVNPESLLRTQALLSFLKPEFAARSIAGRMFLLEEPWIQHTAVEIWNGGDIKHISGGRDMTRREELPEINDAEGGQYGGFWFSCVPYSFAKCNDPLPLFLHCDDVEYGLRQRKEPIILNGIQVWHESPLKRGNRIAAYYDMRNSMIVNSLGYDKKNIGEAAKDILRKWRDRVDLYRENHDIDSENMALLAMEHFLKGPEWVYGTNSGELHQKLMNTGSVEAIDKRALRLAVKLPLGKLNEFKGAGVARSAQERLQAAVRKYREYKTSCE